MISFESWAYSLMEYFGGLLGTNILAASVAMFNVLGLIYRSSIGICAAANTLIGNSIG